MSKNNFWAFLKWYFKYTTKEFFIIVIRIHHHM